MGIDWTSQLSEQLEVHWQGHLRPKLEGLTDEEYFWEPGPGAWSVRPRGSSTAPVQAGSGAFTIDFAIPEPAPPPITTIAWRLAHIIVGVFGMRVSSHFGRRPTEYASGRRPTDHESGRRPTDHESGGPATDHESGGRPTDYESGGPPMDYQSFAYAGSAAEALRQLDEVHAAWAAGVRGLDAAALERPVGPAEGGFAEYPMATLVLHIHREAIHHGAEILLLRDLFRARAA